MKKHVSQMSDLERAALAGAVQGITSWAVLPHAFYRAAKKNVPPCFIALTLQRGRIIEAYAPPYDARDLRVIVRLGEIAVAVSVLRRSIVTVWRNHVRDNHATLNLSAYQWNADLVQELKERKR